ncbi:MAG: DNA cytosine methyltransferase [Planctomycetaceae bacterium]|jgi:hypothetical protein|nr:DNA cytosine methyltransferase [Planctomycetaceae bacterium]
MLPKARSIAPKRTQKSIIREKKRHTLKTQVIIERNTQQIIDVQESKSSEHDFKVYKETIGKGTADSRYLWSEMCRALRQVKPTWAVIENVCGLLAIDDGMVFDKIIIDLENIGYGRTVFYRKSFLPTPLKNDGSGTTTDIGLRSLRGNYGLHSPLNPLFVAEMMGFPTDWTVLPFQAGGNTQSKPTETQ